VVEEKRAFIERQMKEQFFNWPASWGQRPSIVGKYDESGEWILPSTGELTPATIAGVIGRRIEVLQQRIDRAAPAVDAGEGSRACAAARQLPARAALLLGLPAQHLHPCRKARARWPASVAITW
jgi:TPP-dependent indolepyruvate ferredoxin oxidoreductase alpha subunit